MNSFPLGHLLQEILVNDDSNSYGGGCYGDNGGRYIDDGDHYGDDRGRYGELFCLLSSQLPSSTETAFKVKGGRCKVFNEHTLKTFIKEIETWPWDLPLFE